MASAHHYMAAVATCHRMELRALALLMYHSPLIRLQPPQISMQTILGAAAGTALSVADPDAVVAYGMGLQSILKYQNHPEWAAEGLGTS